MAAFLFFRNMTMNASPPLDLTQPLPTQELVAKDLHGYEWRFKHIFRGAGTTEAIVKQLSRVKDIAVPEFGCLQTWEARANIAE